jgi:hypothetical protein
MKEMRYGRVAAIVTTILAIPAVLTLLNPNSHVRGGQGGGWDWSFGPGIFVIYAILFVAGLLIDLSVRKIRNPLYRALAIVLVVTPILFVWFTIVHSD